MNEKEEKELLRRKNKELELLREGIEICVWKIYPAKTVEDAERKIELLKKVKPTSITRNETIRAAIYSILP